MLRNSKPAKFAIWTLLASSMLLGSTVSAWAQQIGVTPRLNRAGSSYSERKGINWGQNNLGQFVNGARPPVHIFGQQSSNRSASVSSPTITMMNGQVGAAIFARQVPFITDVTPVIGARPRGQAQIQEYRRIAQQYAQAKAARLAGELPAQNAGGFGGAGGLAGVARPTPTPTRRARPSAVAPVKPFDQLSDDKAQRFVEKAQGFERQGKTSLAKLYYRMAAKSDHAEAQQVAQAALRRLEG